MKRETNHQLFHSHVCYISIEGEGFKKREGGRKGWKWLCIAHKTISVQIQIRLVLGWPDLFIPHQIFCSGFRYPLKLQPG